MITTLLSPPLPVLNLPMTTKIHLAPLTLSFVFFFSLPPSRHEYKDFKDLHIDLFLSPFLSS